MKLSISLFATLRKFAPPVARNGEFTLEVPQGVTIRELLTLCHLPEQSVTVVMVNGMVAPLGAAIEDEAEISIFPPLAGG